MGGTQPARDRMDASQKSTEDTNLVVAEFIWTATARARPDCIINVFDLVESVTVGKFEGGADGNLSFRERRKKPVLVENRFPSPTTGPIELRDDMGAIIEANVIDPVLEGVERKAVARGRMPGQGDRLQYALGRKAEEVLSQVETHGPIIPRS